MEYNIEQEKQKIIAELVSQGYANKSIDYEEFLQIYEPYKKEMSEKDFALILGITYANYNSMKNRATRAKILKTSYDSISQERKTEMQEVIRGKGYANKLISYEEFLKLYEPYKQEMKERDFALILGITNWNYESMRNKGKRTTILKTHYDLISQQRKIQIEQDLRQQGHGNKSIDYEEFLQIYEPYKKEMKEQDFALILGIAYASYNDIKNKGTRAKVLKTRNDSISQEQKTEIQEVIRKKGYANKIVTYEEFLQLYEPYKRQMKEQDFASILGITDSNYKSMKNKGTRATILKNSKESISEERKAEIQKELMEIGYANQSIDYEEFLQLYEPYKQEMKETDFALILCITYSSYNDIKSKGRKAKILKRSYDSISQERKIEIQEVVRSKGYANKLVTYEEFLKLYEPYQKEISEKDFALILGITCSNFNTMKNKGTRATILKSINDFISQERKIEIQEVIRVKGYANKLVTCEEFLKLYEPYQKEMKEQDFALILGITYSTYNTMKNRRTRTKILRTRYYPISQERKKQIEEELRSKGYTNILITYGEFLQLYKVYEKEMSESEFASILGITYMNHNSMKNCTTRAKIVFDYELRERVKYHFLESRYFSLEEIENIGEKFGLTTEEIMKIIFENSEYTYEMMVKTLYSRGKLFIGQKALNQDFVDQYMEQISEQAHKYSKALGNKLHSRTYSEDIAQDVLIRAVGSKGNLTENFSYENGMDMLTRWIVVAIKHQHLTKLKLKKLKSLDESLSSDGKLTRYTRISTGENIQDNVERKLDSNEQLDQTITPISLMQQCIEDGMDRYGAIHYCMEKFNLTQKQLLKIMTNYLQSKKNIVTDLNGNVYFGDDAEK